MREAWFGLAIDAQSQENADLAIFGIPFDGAVFFRKGAAEGPGRIKDLSSKLPPVAEDGRVLDHMRIRDLPDVSPGGGSGAVFRRGSRAFCRGTLPSDTAGARGRSFRLDPSVRSC